MAKRIAKMKRTIEAQQNWQRWGRGSRRSVNRLSEYNRKRTEASPLICVGML